MSFVSMEQKFRKESRVLFCFFFSFPESTVPSFSMCSVSLHNHLNAAAHLQQHNYTSIVCEVISYVIFYAPAE